MIQRVSTRGILEVKDMQMENTKGKQVRECLLKELSMSCIEKSTKV